MRVEHIQHIQLHLVFLLPSGELQKFSLVFQCRVKSGEFTTHRKPVKKGKAWRFCQSSPHSSLRNLTQRREKKVINKKKKSGEIIVNLRLNSETQQIA